MKNDKSLEEMFLQRRYVLDETLQRSYEWDVKKVVKLIEDILTTKLKSTNGGCCRYNIGDIITYSAEGDRDLDVRYLCDGQQRLTTLVLLFANILHHHPSNETVIRNIAYMLRPPILGTMTPGIILKLKSGDNEVLGKIIDSGINDLTQEEKKSRLAQAYNKITEVFTGGKSGDKLNEFYKQVVDNTSFFERECESQEEAIKQFNNLNGRQQRISNSRIGIAILYGMYNKKMKEDGKMGEFLRNLSNMDSARQKEFLCLYTYYRKNEWRESDVPEMVEMLIEEDGEDVVSDILEFHNYYVKNIESNTNAFISKSACSQTWIDLFSDKYPQMKGVSEEERIATYRICEWGYICNRIKYGGSSQKSKYVNYFKGYDIEKGSLLQYTKELLRRDGLCEPVGIIKDAKVTKDSRKDFFLPLLKVIEAEYEEELKIKEHVNHCCKPSLEHIHPQAMRPDEVYLCDESVVNRFGNMTIIGDDANKSLSNKNFPGKRELYENSPYFINSKHLCKFEKWDNASVEENEKFYYGLLRTYYGLEQCDCGNTERKADVAMEQDAKITE